MSVAKSAVLFGALALLSKVQAHGHVTGVVADGQWYSGAIPNFIFQNPRPVVAGWAADNLDNGFVSDYSSPDIVCHKSATPGGAYIQVTAGSSVELQWTDWPESHRGPVMDFLAACGDDCTTVDKTKLLFNKIDEAGLNDGNTPPGNWASDDLIANNNSWTVTIPASIAPGKYVLRHDTIALHAAFDVGGSQAYPQCFNLEVTGSGTNALSTGTPATSLYKNTDPGIHINIYQKLASYVIPGGPLFDGSSSGPQPPVSSPAAVVSSTSTSAAPVATTTTTRGGRPNIDITASVTAPTAVISTTEVVSTAPTEIATSEPTEASTSVAPVNTDVPPSPGNGAGPGQGQPGQGQSTSPVSFTSTVTGRIGKPTKFTCYIEE